MFVQIPPDITEALEGFEGPEKKLEIDFKRVHSNPRGLREAALSSWESMLDEAKCTIIKSTSNEYFDSYVLSESSLFVYPYKIVIKTCGTTTLLRVIPKLLDIAKECGNLEVDFVFFSRKNFNFPHRQLFPHTSFQDETVYLDKFFNGSGYVLGPLKGDHWFLYLADYTDRSSVTHSDQTLEILMHDLPKSTMRHFFKDDNITVTETTENSGIAALLPGSIIDDHQFEPCGYSMNGLLNEAYWTIHITPEDHCSFVSFETNVNLSLMGTKRYTQLVRAVIETFRPGRVTVTLFADNHDTNGQKSLEAFDHDFEDYKLKNKMFYEFDTHYDLTMCSFTRMQETSRID